MIALVSIITPCYNAEDFITQMIESVQAQTYKYWELIIVDDCSTDKSYSIIEQYTNDDNRIICIKNPKNLGAAKSRNIAIKAAKGRFIAFLDADDIWFPKKLTMQMEFMKKHGLVLTYSAYDTINESGEYINTRNPPKRITYKSMLRSNHIGNLTGIYDTQFFGKVMLSQDGHEDYILWLSLIKKIDYTLGISKPLAAYRILPNSISANKTKAIKWQWNIYRKYEGLTLFQSIYYLLWYIYYALKKRV